MDKGDGTGKKEIPLSFQVPFRSLSKMCEVEREHLRGIVRESTPHLRESSSKVSKERRSPAFRFQHHGLVDSSANESHSAGCCTAKTGGSKTAGGQTVPS